MADSDVLRELPDDVISDVAMLWSCGAETEEVDLSRVIGVS